MSETRETGGPAFPQLIKLESNQLDAPDYYAESAGGMELRDYFATAALQGMLASDSSVDRTQVNKVKWARVAYEFADAMLKARQESPRG